jgi:predicted O-methyltransferase YrrM
MFHEDAANDYDNPRKIVANPELHMIATIKTQLRQMRREGKAVGLINAIAYGNYQMKNFKDWMNAGTMKKLLDQRAFSPETDKLVQFTMSESGGAIRPLQNPWEIGELMKRVRAKQPRVIVEIGTAKGGTLFLFCQHAADDATIISLDLPFGRNGGGYPKWKEKLYAKFAKPGQTLHLMRANSHLDETRTRIEALLKGRKIDVLMIDADHSYEGVKRDYDLYSPLLADDGFIAMHDVILNRFDPEIEVHKFWDELKATEKTEELVHDYGQGNLGIGIVRR